MAEFVLQLLDADAQIILEQRHSASDALHACRLQFAHIRMESPHHQFGIGVVKHRAVYDVAVALMIEGIATHLAARQFSTTFQHDVVPARHGGGGTQRAEAFADAVGIFGEEVFHGACARNETYHDIALIGKDGAATALSAYDVNAVLPAEVHVHLLVSHLIAPHDDRRPQAPGEEIIVCWERLCHILFCRQIERCPPKFAACWQFYIAGREMLYVCYFHAVFP